MRKTVNVNIGSLPFTMDDNAYQTLNDYLNDIEARLGADDHGSMRNIEVRIARLFDSRLNDKCQVVNIDMVRDAMAMIGTPASFGSIEPQAEPTPKMRHSQRNEVEYIDAEEVNQSEPRSLERMSQGQAVAHREESEIAPAAPIEPQAEPYDYPTHLYRSREERMIAGVCGGIAKYTNLPVGKIRITAVVLAIFAGLTLIAYFIMWYLIPEEPLLDVNGNVIDTSEKKEE